MSYIGQHLPADVFGAYTVDTFTGNGSATTFTLSKAPANENALLVVIDNVVQQPTTNFTVSGTTLTIVGTAILSGITGYAIHTQGKLPVGTASDLGSTIFTSQTDIGANIADADLFLVDDGAGGTVRKTAASRLKTYIGSFDADAAQVFNDSGAAVDFRIEGDTNQNLFFVDGSADKVGIGTNAPDMLFDVTGSSTAGAGSDESLQQWNIGSDNVKASMKYIDDSGTRGMKLAVDSAHALHLGTEGSSNIYIQAGGQTWINRTTSNQNDHDSGKVERLGVTESSGVRNNLYLSNTNASMGTYLYRGDTTRSSYQYAGFLIGSTGNESDNQVRLMGDGNMYCDGSWSGGGADYAEFFEWKDGNTDNEDRVGCSVVLDGDKIVKATDSDDSSKIIGGISARPVVIGDSQWDRWQDKYLKDDFGKYIMEEFTGYEFKDSQGNKVSYESGRIPDGVIIPDDATIKTTENDGVTKLTRPKRNPDWNEEQVYVARQERKEWDTVGLMGKLRLKKGQPTGTNWIKMRDISDTVEEWLVR